MNAIAVIAIAVMIHKEVNMIIKGMITTNDGPVDIAELKAGHKILNQMHRAFAVSKVENMKASEAILLRKIPIL